MSVTDLRISMDFLTSLTGGLVYLHGKNRNQTSAFELSESASVIFYIPRALGAVSVQLELFGESGNRPLRRINGTWQGISADDDIYQFSLAGGRVGLYYYRPVVKTACGPLFGYPHEGSVRFTDCAESALFQLSFSEFAYPLPKDVYGGVIYHCFVDRFRRGGQCPVKSGAVLGEDFSDGIPEYPAYPGAPLKNNTFYGGTLYGVIEKLDYLSSLGVSLIYLSPIFESPSNHKYDTSDYMSVDSMFGGEAALQQLIEEAKSYGIGIILDGVFNHTGADSMYFNKYGNYKTVGAYQSKSSAYYSWYHFNSYPNDYEAWWGIEILPRIHPDVKSCQEYFIGQGGVIRKYAKMGIKGFRLDVADELSDAFISKIKSAFEDEAPGGILYGEVWEDASNKIAYGVRKKYYLGRELDGVMNYPLREGIIDFLRNHKAEKLRYALEEVTNNTPKRILNMQMNLLGTHDTVRIITALAGESAEGYSNDVLVSKRMTAEEYASGKKLLKMAYTILATLPGIPSIYYGDETGLQGYSDPFNRMPHPWEKSDSDLVLHYQKIGSIRKENNAYKSGEFQPILISDDALIFARTDKSKALITVANNSEKPICLSSTRVLYSLCDGKKGNDIVVNAKEAKILRTHIDTEIKVNDLNEDTI